MVPGLLAIIFTGFLTEKSIEFLIRNSRAGNLPSYGSLMRDSFGKFGKALVEIFVIVNNIGVLIIYTIILVAVDRHNIATKRDKILSVFMIFLAVLSNAVALYSDTYALIKKNKTYT
ncbi:hypothetical protein V8G54_011217 [Vigna mungo]|uniref:Amino acid transporter transmembrane domain-containing protein n=1 Tax=Vigna mungo TaxID=3915 RepID=A0AAQ3S2Q5_VIGMU